MIYEFDSSRTFLEFKISKIIGGAKLPNGIRHHLFTQHILRNLHSVPDLFSTHMIRELEIV